MYQRLDKASDSGVGGWVGAVLTKTVNFKMIFKILFSY